MSGTVHLIAVGMVDDETIETGVFHDLRIKIRQELKPFRLKLTQHSKYSFTLRRFTNKQRTNKVCSGTLQEVCRAAMLTIDPENYNPAR